MLSLAYHYAASPPFSLPNDANTRCQRYAIAEFSSQLRHCFSITAVTPYFAMAFDADAISAISAELAATCHFSYFFAFDDYDSFQTPAAIAILFDFISRRHY
jgi:hypothetical protein